MVKKIILTCFTFFLAVLIGQASRPTVAQTQYLGDNVFLFVEELCELDALDQQKDDENTDLLLLGESFTEQAAEEDNEIDSEYPDEEPANEDSPLQGSEEEFSEPIDDSPDVSNYEHSRNSEELPIITTVSYLNPPIEDLDINDDVFFDTAFDPRESRNTLTPVKNQGQIDVCWTFAANAVLESFLKLTTGIEYNFSEEHMRFATSADGGNWLGFDRTNHEGGTFPMAAAYWMRQSLSGPVLASNDPSTVSEIPRSVDITASKPRLGKVTDTRYLPSLPNGLTPGSDTTNSFKNQIKRFIVDYGSAYMFYSHDEDVNGVSWQEGPNGMLSYYQKNTGFYHAAVIVGWDDDYCVSNFYIEPPSNGAWLVKNSWGSDWSDGGFFWMSYHTPIFGVATVAGFQKNFSYAILCYTPFGGSAHIAFEGIHTIYAANIFDCDDPNAVLRAIQFYNKNPNSSYSVHVAVAYRNEISDENLLRTAVTSAAVTSGTFREKGYYTLDLGNIALGSNKIFAVVVRVDSATGTAVAPIEAGTSNSRQSPGQSFVSSDSFHWWDTLENGNVVIQALVSNGTGSTNAERLP